MRAIGLNDYLAITGLKRGTFDARQTLKEMPFAFGLARRLAGGVMLDLDCICFFIGEALTPVLSREHAATIIRAFADDVLEAVGRADAEPDETWFLNAVEFGPGYGQITRDNDRQMIFGATTAEHFAETFRKNPKNPKAKQITRITWVNVTHILADLRIRAAKHGFDWSAAAFFPPPDDPMAAKIIKTARKERELALQAYAQDQLAKHSEARR